MNFAKIKPLDISNGPGIRVSLFVSGCTQQCEDCFNQDLWDFNYGEPFTDVQMNQILKYLEPDYITGFTVLGGEPLEKHNYRTVYDVIRKIKNTYLNKSIWMYTGGIYENIIASEFYTPSMALYELISMLDVLVDGKFEKNKKDLTLKFRGSSNQRLIDVQESIRQGNVVVIKD